MKSSIITYIRKTLSARLTLWVVSFSVILFISSLFIIFHFSRQALKEEAIQNVNETLEGTILYIDNTLHQVEVSTRNMLQIVEYHLDKPDYMQVYSQKIIEENSNISACAIAFEPNYYASKNKYYMAYAYRTSAMNVGSNILQSDSYGSRPYVEQEWYAHSKNTNAAYWTEPTNEGNTGPYTVISYSMPIHNQQQQVVGVIACDISYRWLLHIIHEAKPFPNSYSVILTNEADSIALEEHIHDSYVFYKSFNKVGWKLAIVCPKTDVYKNYNQLRYYMVLIICLGILLLSFFCIAVIRWEFRPLNLLDRSVRHIAEEDFEDTIPPSDRLDEVGNLQNSFRTMQQSTRNYLEKAKHSSMILQERNEALRVAYEKSQESDRVKAAFLHNMTDQMVRPLSGISQSVNTLKENYQHFEEADITQLVDTMQAHTNKITVLLDRLLKVSIKQ